MAENKGVLPSSNVNTLGNANNKWENVYSKKFTGALTGNASTASSAAQLTTARSINGTNFNGTGNITTANWGTARNISIADATATNTGTGVSVNGSGNVTLKLPATIKASLTGNVTGNVSGSSSSCTGNAATATKLATARTINIQDSSATNTGTGASFDGSGNATIKLPATIKANVTGNCSGSSGSCTGNSATATKATQDSAGQQINTTYIKGLSASNATLTYTKGNGTTGTVTVNNVATATNADKLDGYHYSDIVTKIQGKATPTMTALVDWAAMTTACNLSPATVSVSTVVDGSSVTLSVPSIKDIRNTNTGIIAYDGDINSGSLTGKNRPFYNGDIILKQSYKNFDKIFIVFSNDDGDIICHKIWEKWELEHAFDHSYRFTLFETVGIYWLLYGTKKQGTITNQRLSTDTFWRSQEQNSGIVEIYGLKY